MKSKIAKYVGGVAGALIVGAVLMLTTTKIVYPAISQLVGLAVAQSATTWNNVADAAKGDGLSSGILAQSPYLWNGLSFDRMRSAPAADGSAVTGFLAQTIEVFNGTTYDRVRSASGVNNTQTTVLGAIQVANLSTWTITNVTTNAGTPSATKTSGGGTVRHVVTSVSGCIAAAATAQPAVEVDLKDGSTVLRSWSLAGIVNSGQCFSESGLNITGSAATNMVLVFAAATAANVIASVNASGYSTP